MGDYIYYQTASGRIAKRDYKSTADLRNALRSELNPDDEAELQAALDKRMEKATKGQRTVARGWGFMQKVLESARSKFMIDDALGFISDLPADEITAADRRQMVAANLVSLTMKQQVGLKAEFEAQELADKEAENREKLAKASERKEKIAAVRAKRKRKGAES